MPLQIKKYGLFSAGFKKSLIFFIQAINLISLCDVSFAEIAMYDCTFFVQTGCSLKH